MRDTFIIELYFDAVVESKINEDYDNTSLNFKLYDKFPEVITDFDSPDVIGYITFDANGAAVIEGGDRIFSEADGYGTLFRTSGGVLKRVNGELTMCGIGSAQSLKFEINTSGAAKYYILYFGGMQCTAKVTVRDRAGNVITEVFGDLSGMFARAVVIECGKEGILYVTYAAVAGETDGSASPTRVYFYGAIATVELPYGSNDVNDDLNNNICVEYESAVDPNRSTLDISSAGIGFGEEILDWMHYRGDGSMTVQSAGGSEILGATFIAGGEFDDYHGIFVYPDGEGVSSASGTASGAYGSEIFLYVKVDEQTEHIIVYTGAWRATNTVEIYTWAGTRLYSEDLFSAGDNSVCNILTFGVGTEPEAVLVIRIKAKDSSGGNVQLAAAAVTGRNQR